MDMNEFNATAVRTENPNAITFDVRPFGDRQGEAVDSYLHAALGAVQMGVSTFQRPVIVLCDSTAAIPDSASTWLATLNAQGVAMEIRRA
jgi:hypothetical protein